MCFLIVFGLVISFSDKSLDGWGHVGGLLVGIPLGVLFLKPAQEQSKAVKLASILSLAVFFVTFTIWTFAQSLEECD